MPKRVRIRCMRFFLRICTYGGINEMSVLEAPFFSVISIRVGDGRRTEEASAVE